MEPKAKTLMEKMGFVDSDLKTPMHDEIMLWAVKAFPKYFIDKNPGFELSRCRMEVPVTANTYSSKFIVGFLDMVFDFKRVTKEMRQETMTGTVYNSKGEKVGFGRNILLQRDVEKEEHVTVSVEIKSKISNLGELFRQINAYREHLGNNLGRFFVISPDAEFEDALRAEKIEFLKYDPKLMEKLERPEETFNL